ncbi:alpha/beta fold hydrolase [Sphingomonas ginkgonis]|uniref:Alpha/beta fold hydrolase n=1 Tax=Sphingomonas ginkgonis TaxID=2315330 RepID=A0A429VA47_9SPHN|nr:alpha/beta fold hydrolase [Sphingomonas ginkgonis]RST30834.1 alpha/beta fold hydrolase [Sphingomonas ginkgonis]
MTATSLQRWTASDGVELAYHEVGAGRAVILLHGLFSDAQLNWVKFGHAARLEAAGFRVIMPDLRAHGASGKPHDPACYPPGILARDLRELVAGLSLADYDLGGFSLGGRTTVQAVGEGAQPRRAVLGGMGIEGLQRWVLRKRFFLDAIDGFDAFDRGDPHWLTVQFMKSQKIDRVAARLLLDGFEDARMDWLEAFTMPTLVVCGTEDHDNGSALELSQRLPNAIYVPVPGTHMSSVTKPELGHAIAQFLAG